MTTAAVDRSACVGTVHGTANAYRNQKCRCPDARRANTTYQKKLRAGVLPPGWVSTVGLVRRRRALAAMGWGLSDLAPLLGLGSLYAVNNHVRRPRVRRVTFEKWLKVYDQLSMTPGPNEKAREHARKQGWPPPLAWDDDDIDNPDAEPALMPRRVKIQPDLERIAAALAGDQTARRALRHPDRRQIVRQLHAEGLMDTEIAAASGIPKVTVMRVRGELCLLSNCSRDVRRREGFGKGAA